MTEPKDPVRAPQSDIPHPDYAATAPSDWLGTRAVRIMLDDLNFPRTAGELRERAGLWKVPARSPNDTVTLGKLLEPFEDNERFRSPSDAARQIGRRNHGF